MSWSGDAGTRVVGEFLVGVVTAIIALALFLPIPLEWKATGIVVLAAEGILLLIVILGKGARIIWRLRDWTRHKTIRRHPEFVCELYRLEKRIYAVLYERSSDHPSLRLQGWDAVSALSPPGDTSPLVTEFQEKVDICTRAFSILHHRLEERSRGYRWKTLEFVYALREISNHLELLNQVFTTAYRVAARNRNGGEIPPNAWDLWEAFKDGYNVVLQEWKTFTERFDQAIGYGTGTRAEPAKSLR